MACSKDRYTATYVVAPLIGPPDCQAADFTDIQTAINALPLAGGKIFVKAGSYVVSKTIRITASNVHIQGEGMGITNIIADQMMTAIPAIEAYDPNAGNPLPLVTGTAKGDTTVTLSPANASTLTAGDHILLYSNKPVDAEDPAKHAGEIKQLVAVDPQTGVIMVDTRFTMLTWSRTQRQSLRLPCCETSPSRIFPSPRWLRSIRELPDLLFSDL